MNLMVAPAGQSARVQPPAFPHLGCSEVALVRGACLAVLGQEGKGRAQGHGMAPLESRLHYSVKSRAKLLIKVIMYY